MSLKSTTGTIASATDKVALGLSGENTLGAIVLYGTYTGVTVVFEATNDGTNWVNLPVINTATLQPALASSVTLASNATQGYFFTPGTFQQVRVRATAWSTGTANVQIYETGGTLLPVIPDQSYGNTLNNVGTSTVTQVAGVGSNNFNLVAGPGILQRYVVTTTGGAATSISFYDSATSSIAGLKPLYTSAQAETLGTVKEINIPFTNGLTIATVNTSAAVTVAVVAY